MAGSNTAGSLVLPGADRTTDDEILGWVKKAAETTYHPVGTLTLDAGVLYPPETAPLRWAVDNVERSINPLILHHQSADLASLTHGRIAQGVSQALLESIGVSTEG